MASACVNSIGPPLPPKFTSFSWLTPKNISCNHPPPPPVSLNPVQEEEEDPTATSNSEFEFHLEGADVRMLPADELFSDGKLVPLQLSVQPPPEEDAISEVTTPKIRLREDPPLGSGQIMNDPSSGYLFSPRAPTCSSRWKELLGFKRFYHNTTTNKQPQQHVVVVDNHKPAAAALKTFLHRTQKSSVSPHVDSSSSLTLPLIQQDGADNNDSFSIYSSRLSLSCSSFGGDDFPRHSLDSEKRRPYHRSSERMSADSPRMNSSGKIVFHSLERSSSSPSTLNGGPRYKYRGMERSYSANVRYTRVLNVPVCSLRGSSATSTSSKSGGVFGFPLFSPSQQQKKDGDAIKGNRKNRSDRGVF